MVFLKGLLTRKIIIATVRYILLVGGSGFIAYTIYDSIKDKGRNEVKVKLDKRAEKARKSANSLEIEYLIKNANRGHGGPPSSPEEKAQNIMEDVSR